MDEDLSLQVWTWYATNEYRPVLHVCSGLKALDFLQSPSALQTKRVSCCPDCDINDLMSDVWDFQRSLPPGFRTLEGRLAEVWDLCHQLPESAFPVDESDWFIDPAWESVRLAAAAALERADWDALRIQVDELDREIRQTTPPSTLPKEPL